MRARLPVWLAIAVAFSNAIAEADDLSAPKPPGGVEEIVVTARKTEENIQDVPVAVTALSGENLAQSSTFEMKDLGLRVPNLLTQYGANQPTSLTFQLRGQVQGDILGTLDPSVGFYDDGVYVARAHGANAAFIDVKNVQVLRGPQGTLFGRNTTGGAVLLTTNDPDLEGASGSFSATGGNFGRSRFGAVVNVPLARETLAVRFVADHLDTRGYAFERTNARDIGTENHDLVRAKILYRPFDALSFSLAAQYLHADLLGPPAQPVFALKPSQARQLGVCCLASLDATAAGVDYDSYVGGDRDRVDYDPGLEPTSRITVKSLAFTPVWDLSWTTVKLIVGWRENEDVSNRLDIDATPATIVDSLQENFNEQQSYELQLTGSWLGDRLSWAAGAVYFDESGGERGTTLGLLPLLALLSPIVTPGDIDNRSVGGYAQATYSLTPKLRVTGGLRYSWDEKRLFLHDSRMGVFCAIPVELQDHPDGAIVGPFGTLGTDCRGTFEDSFDDVSWLAGADYRLFEDGALFDDMLLYVSVATGYRAGGQNLRGTSVATLAPFKPETLIQFEAGFKSELFERRVRFNAAGFYALYDDIQRSIIIASNSVLPSTLVANAASAEISGAELELAALPPIDGLAFGASFGLTLPKYNEYSDASGDRSNERFDFVPKWSYALSGGYTRELFGEAWSFHVDWSWKDEIPNGQGSLAYFRSHGIDLESELTIPPTGILSARTALAFANGLELALFGKNLTDERTFLPIVLGGGPDFVQKTYTNAPREFGGDVTFRF